MYWEIPFIVQVSFGVGEQSLEAPAVAAIEGDRSFLRLSCEVRNPCPETPRCLERVEPLTEQLDPDAFRDYC
jgi:hypothetical protein